MFRAAIVRPPSTTFAHGLTTGAMGSPDLELASSQHRSYCQALEQRGLDVIALEPDAAYPDSTFVEDAAVLTPGGVILARPGAPTRRGEVSAVKRALEPLVPRIQDVVPPGTLDGGDVCEADGHYFVGISQRTNLAGARQLATLLAEEGIECTMVDIRPHSEVLHLKSAVASLGERRMVAAGPLATHPAFEGFEMVRVAAEESFGANCVRFSEHVLMPAGCPKLEEQIRALGLSVVVLDVSEFQKMDGGLSCLSLRLPAWPSIPPG